MTLHGEGSSDPDGETLSYTWTKTSGPNNITLTGANTVNPTFTAPTPIWADVSYTFQLEVCDGSNGHCATDLVVVTVKDSIPNTVPVANAGDDKNVIDYELFTLDATGSSDADGGPNALLSYTWTQTLGTPVTISNDYLGHATIRAPYTLPATPETLTFEVEVCDGQGCDTDEVSVTVGDRASKSPVPDYNEGFESGAFNISWVSIPTVDGRTRVWDNFTPRTGTYHVLQDSQVDNSWSLNQLVLFADLAGKTDVYVEFYHKHFNDEGHQMPASFVG
ncbi:MAG TPA: hypothetical protein PKH10_09940, partial [bacterium]|nr:hypothetical protein [bacterium]